MATPQFKDWLRHCLWTVISATTLGSFACKAPKGTPESTTSTIKLPAPESFPADARADLTHYKVYAWSETPLCAGMRINRSPRAIERAKEFAISLAGPCTWSVLLSLGHQEGIMESTFLPLYSDQGNVNANGGNAKLSIELKRLKSDTASIAAVTKANPELQDTNVDISVTVEGGERGPNDPAIAGISDFDYASYVQTHKVYGYCVNLRLTRKKCSADYQPPTRVTVCNSTALSAGNRKIYASQFNDAKANINYFWFQNSNQRFTPSPADFECFAVPDKGIFEVKLFFMDGAKQKYFVAFPSPCGGSAPRLRLEEESSAGVFDPSSAEQDELQECPM